MMALKQAQLDCTLSARLDSIITAAIADGASPGAAVAVVRYGHVVMLKGYGRTDWDTLSPSVDANTLYDLASLTKVVGTTTLAMMLEESGQLDLDRTVASYVPELNAPEKAAITVRQLLIHRGGFEAFAALFRDYRGRNEYLTQINERPLASQPGTNTVYSDWDMILLQAVIERSTGQSLDSLVDETVFRPLGMTDTRYLPPPELLPRIAPTEVDTMRGGLVRGFVHDENAWAMGGVAGHAGLFSTARDLAVFAEMMLANGEVNGIRLLKPRTLARWTAPQGADASRALGWDTPSQGSSAGRYFSPRSFGHTGFTGTSIWMDPEKNLAVVLLTNRVNPTRNNTKVGPLRRAVADAVQEAVLGVPLVNWEARR
jgi:CubicO group peptidase (beta-lactamase class C family)